MRPIAPLVLAAAVSSLCSAAWGQSYPAPDQDPCHPPPPTRNIFGLYTPPANDPQRDAACREERRQQWDSYRAAQQAERDRAAAARAQAEAEAAREQSAAAEKQRLEAAQAAADQIRQQQAAAEQRAQEAASERRIERAALVQRNRDYELQMAAEASPENHCKQPDFARAMMDNWSELDAFKILGLKALDIEHLTTTAYDPTQQTIRCHGVFVTNRGVKFAGTFSRRNNVAGDPIWSWEKDESDDLSRYEPPPPVPKDEPAATTPVVDVTASSAVSVPSSFDRGLADRKRWEGWFGGLTGDAKDGATWWAGNRSLAHHGQCVDRADASEDWRKGCLDAQHLLTVFDARRRTDPVYKKGWNSL